MSAMDVNEIMRLLPHRYPMLLVDKVLECDDEKWIVAVKNVTANEPFFQGHFPGQPVMPGVLQLEAMAQAAGVLLSRKHVEGSKIPYFMSIDKAKFRKVVKPGDQMRIEVEIINNRSKSAKFKGKALVDGAVVSEAEMVCMVSDKEV